MSRAYVLTAGSQFVPGGISYPSGWTRLLFNDEFNGSSIDTTKWTVRNSTTQNNMSARNFARNCTVANGYLSIRSGTDNDVDPASHPWTSGYLDTIGKFSTTDARWEARMRMPWGPTANGYWPAFWLRPEDGEWIVRHLREVHALAWASARGPLDIRAGETRPRWLDAQ